MASFTKAEIRSRSPTQYAYLRRLFRVDIVQITQFLLNNKQKIEDLWENNKKILAGITDKHQFPKKGRNEVLRLTNWSTKSL